MGRDLPRADRGSQCQDGKHAARRILQSVGIGALAGLLWGDFSATAASVPVTLGVLRYSRDFEREADEFAIVLLRSQNVSARPLYEFFNRLQEMPAGQTARGIPGFLSTHPSASPRWLTPSAIGSSTMRTESC